MIRELRNLWRGDDASVTLQVLFFAIGLFGVTGLVVDFGRIYTLNTQMQTYVDQIAMAAAAELDGTPGSIARADEIAFGRNGAQYLPKIGGYAAGDPADNILTVRNTFYYSADMIGNAGSQLHQIGVTGDDALIKGTPVADFRATHVVVVAEPRRVNYSMLRLLRIFGGDNPDTSFQFALALAGRNYSFCGATPIVMCNPFENWEQPVSGDQPHRPLRTGDPNFTDDFDNRNADGQRRDYDETTGRYIEMKVAALRVPGFGELNDAFFMETPSARAAGACSIGVAPQGGRANGLPDTDEDAHQRCMMAISETRTACIGDSIQFRRGQPRAIAEGLNTRFDIWDAPIDQVLTSTSPIEGRDESLYDLIFPDVNVIKGRDWEDPALRPAETGGNPADYDALGPEGDVTRSLFSTDNRIGFTNTIPICAGCGVYWQPSARDLNDYFDRNWPDAGGLPQDIDTRYEIYKYERENFDSLSFAEGGESPNPTFYGSLTDEQRQVERRRLTIAFADCLQTEEEGNGLFSAPVTAVRDVFLMEPVRPNDDEITIRVEIVGEPDTNIAREQRIGGLSYPMLGR
jgi:hypothetical protein